MNHLKIKSIAKYKSLKSSDLKQYDDIQNGLLDLPAIKGKAFEDSSMEEMEREVISDLSHRGLNNYEMNYGRKSENSEALFSAHSSQDYWEEKL